MSALWPHWQRPLWLLLLPLLGWLLWQLWHRQRRIGRWQMLLPPAFHAALLSGGHERGSRLPWIALGLAWLLVLLALLGPSWQRAETASQKRADPLVVLLELTPEMLAGDAPPTRLEQARRKLLDLLEARRDGQTAIVVYAGSAHTLVPLSDDLATSRNLLEALKPSIMPVPGHRADLAVAKAIKLLEQGAQGEGQLLLIGSSLDEAERQGIRQALKRHSLPLHILGIGTAQGAPIAEDDGGFLKDAQGAILLPRLDSASLKRFATKLDGHYASARLDDSDLRSLGLLADAQSLRNGEETRLAAWADQGHWLLLPLLLLAACAGRRGWLFGLPLLLLVHTQPSYALEFDDLWLRADQQGQRLLAAQRPAEAAQQFQSPQWQGLALYQAGDYAGAASRFAQGDSANDHYNRGNALAKSGELEAALDAYEQALQRQPELQPALKNKALVEQLLRQQQERQSEQPTPPAGEDASEQAQQGQDGENQEPAPESASSQQQPGDSPEQQVSGPAGQVTEAGQAQSGQAEAQDNSLPAQANAEEALDGEKRQAMEQWLRQIPDEPGELLRRKFLYEQQQRQESHR
ncbi:VWA domain-containing protein [Pseudomonas cavernae]|uniref:VWA domain-containing protein n=1 Tax=Pseudomonas cavernae TaxID=2320867 RepID=A0A385Z458_9PSED|nr:VWA domain-containing protein [Pseudomonas cavernae]AYC33491.1 VWA domain-containing protein [Pseudomonas cavernae]